MFTWQRDNDFGLAALVSPAGEIAASLVYLRSADFFYDQLFVKEDGTPHPKQWHQDQRYWPVIPHAPLLRWEERNMSRSLSIGRRS
jgi:hypothetical protein